MADSEDKSKDKMFGDFSSLDDFSQTSLKRISKAIAASNGLPSNAKQNYSFYSTFKDFRKVMASERSSIEGLIDQLLVRSGVFDKPRFAALAAGQFSTSEVVELLTEVNDHMLEKINTSLDEAEGLKKMDESARLIVESKTESRLSGAWNKKIESNSQSMKLVTAKNILRPQMKFKAFIDNSNTPFVPSLKEKPHSKKPLSILVEYDENGDEFYSHPYQYELELFKPEEKLLENEAIEIKDLENADFTFVDTEKKFEDMIEFLEKSTKEEKSLGVDLEHHWYRSYQGFTCLIQISTLNKDFVVDPFEIWPVMNKLNQIFANPSVVKIFHGADSDLMWLQRDFGIYVVNLFDTHQAAKMLGFPQGSRKFDNILLHYCKINTDKKFQLADWRIRPLPEDMLKYARLDTRFLIPIYRMMKKALLEQGNEFKNLLLSTFEIGTQMCKRRYKKPTSEAGHEDLVRKSRATFNSRQMFALKEIFAWRNKLARDEDESEQFVLPNHMLLKICSELPREMQGILACCNPIPPLVKQALQPMHMIILKAREQPLTLIKHDIEKPSSSVVNKIIDENKDFDVENPLKSPLDLRQNIPVKGHSVLEDLEDGKNSKTILNLNSNSIKIKKHPDLILFKSKKSSILSGKSEFMSPYERYQSLKPYLKFLHSKEDSKDGELTKEEQEHAEKVRSIREHFDAMTAMTAQEYSGENAEENEQKMDEKSESESESEEEEKVEIDSGKVQPLRSGLSKNRKRKGQKSNNDSAKKAKNVDYENADFKNFGKKDKEAKAFDPWQNYSKKHKKGGGK